MKKGKKNKKNFISYIIDRWILFLLAGIILYVIGFISRQHIRNYLLNSQAQIINAVIINEKNYWGNSPLSHTFSYSYEFHVNETYYRKDSRNETLKVGDSVLIEYLPIYPNFNRIEKNK